MKVIELAREMDEQPEAVMELLDKEDKFDEITEEEAARVRKVLIDATKKVASPKKRKVIRFWSDVRRFSFAVPVRQPAKGEAAQGVPTVLMRFKDYRLSVIPGSIVHKTIIGLEASEVRVVVDEPFKDLGKTKAFRELLENGIYTGHQRQASTQRGITYVMSLFNPEDRHEAAKALTQYGVGGLIELAVRTKSYIETPYKGV